MANSALIAAIILLFSVMLMNASPYNELRKVRDEIRIDIHKVFMNNSKMPVTTYNRRSYLLLESQMLRKIDQRLVEINPNADSDLDKEAQRETETILRTMLLDGGSHLTVMKCLDKYIPKIMPYDASFANILDNLITYKYGNLPEIFCPAFEEVDKKEIDFSKVKEAFGKVITLDTINLHIAIGKTIELLTLMKLHPDLLNDSQMIIENKINTFYRYLSNIKKSRTMRFYVSWINAPLVTSDWDIVAFWSQCGATNGTFFSPTKVVLNVPVGVMINLLAIKFNVNCMKNLGTVSTKCEN